MNEREALEAIEKEIACKNEDPEICNSMKGYPTCKHYMPIEKYFSALAVAVRVLRERAEGKGPCLSCRYEGKHLDAPPCTSCPAQPKEAGL